MSARQRRDTFSDAELTELALEIMEDFRQLSTKGNVDPYDSYIFDLENKNSNHTDNQLLSPAISQSVQHEPITIISQSSVDSLNNVLPPIPSSQNTKPSGSSYPDSSCRKEETLKIRIPGNKKRGIKRWSNKHRKTSSFNTSSTSISKQYINNNDILSSPISPSNKPKSPSYSPKINRMSHCTVSPSIDTSSCLSPIKHRQSTKTIGFIDNKHRKKKGKKRKCGSTKSLMIGIDDIDDIEGKQCISHDSKKKNKKRRKKKKYVESKEIRSIDSDLYHIMNNGKSPFDVAVNNNNNNPFSVHSVSDHTKRKKKRAPQIKSNEGKRNQKVQKKPGTPDLTAIARKRRDKRKKKGKKRASSVASSRYNDENEYMVEVEDEFIFINDLNLAKD